MRADAVGKVALYKATALAEMLTNVLAELVEPAVAVWPEVVVVADV